MPPGLVIFDCDGVLVDTEVISSRRLAEWLTEAGYPITFQTCLKRFAGRPMAEIVAEIEAEGTPLGADFVERWNAGLPALFAGGVTEIPHVRAAVAAIRGAGIPYCVASSGRVAKMRLTLGATGLLPLFEHGMFSATMVARGKPFPDLFLHAAEATGVAPARCAVVEDSVAGARAGIAAGMKVFAYHADPHADIGGLRAAGAELFDDMRDLPRLLRLAPVPLAGS